MATAATKPAVTAAAKKAVVVAKPATNSPSSEGVARSDGVVASASASDTIWVRTIQGVKRRCRSGMAFGEKPVAVPVDDLTQDQLDAIEADPLLVEVDAPAAVEADVAAVATDAAAGTAKAAE